MVSHGKNPRRDAQADDLLDIQSDARNGPLSGPELLALAFAASKGSGAMRDNVPALIHSLHRPAFQPNEQPKHHCSYAIHSVLLRFGRGTSPARRPRTQNRGSGVTLIEGSRASGTRRRNSARSAMRVCSIDPFFGRGHAQQPICLLPKDLAMPVNPVGTVEFLDVRNERVVGMRQIDPPGPDARHPPHRALQTGLRRRNHNLRATKSDGTGAHSD